MDYIFPREELSALLDEITRAITRREAGICLSLMENAPEEGPEDNPGTPLSGGWTALPTPISTRA